MKEEDLYEIRMDDKMIDGLIEKLKELKENEEHIHFTDLDKKEIMFIHKNSTIV